MCYKVEIAEGKAKVFTPYNADFVKRIKQVGGARWDAESKCWTVAEDAVPAVREIMRNVYGRDDVVEGETVKVRLTFNSEVSAWRDSVTVLGHSISHAWGRDSGAKPGDDVYFISGGCTSGGSVKNWYSVVKEGSVVELGKVAKDLLESQKDQLAEDDISFEIIENKMINKTVLEEERKRLMERIAEIDRLLAE